ncbi:crotonase/enoyl-CoA hydratase family protein [[Mycobacterium] holstebronense]|uniref:Crotonase/enoyl-CoA hydratase family protein n=1 Tax=[Mycobacterium] holstebronense TaxID=3064288 RepID=A0ABN9NRN1_9MYCO|nr:crotonase/enoyl-CoA hydratase family protein [Mycolicibacter sp. MU0102]CAJ1510823.1 crotonase/enoyl-CoA hydratase family protein [Mycolicibacter sp. MU0102]
MAQERITVEVIAGIAYVTLNRADKMNSLDLPMLQALASVPDRLARDRSVRVVILCGDGRAFSTGLDFAGAKLSGLAGVRNFGKLPGQKTNLFQQACWAWRELPVPVIAALHGHCYGGGLQLALAADFRITTPDCKLSIMEAKWGLIPDMTGAVTLRELLPMDVAKRLTMTAEVFSGTDALGYGLVTSVADEPVAAAQELAAQLAERSPDALAATKKLFHSTWTSSPRRTFWTESVLQLRLLRGRNHRLARKAGRDGRPVWEPRSFG